MTTDEREKHERLIDELLNLGDESEFWDDFWIGEVDEAAEMLVAAQREIRELREVVGRFATMADEETPKPRDTIWWEADNRCIYSGQVEYVGSTYLWAFINDGTRDRDSAMLQVSQCYSTREALEQAIGEQP
jgi:hypothetical protein